MLLTLLAVAISLAHVGALNGNSEQQLRVALVSDLHYDLHFGTPDAYGPCTNSSVNPLLPLPYCDTSLQLMRSTMDDIMLQSPDYIFLLGDWARHGLDFDDVESVFETAAGVLDDYNGGVMPMPNLAGVMGNNDVFPHDSINVTQLVHPHLETVANILIRHGLLLEQEEETFRRCGYYARNVTETLTIMVTNTLVWSDFITPKVPLTDADPCGQFEYFETVLQMARRSSSRKVLVLGHSPMALNWHSMALDGDASGSSYAEPRFYRRYRSIIANFTDVIAGQLWSHTHRFSMSADYPVPTLNVPSISRKSGNTPSYLMAAVTGQTWQLDEITMRVENQRSAAWEWGPSLSNFTGRPVTPAGMRASATRMLSDSALFETFLSIFGGGVNNMQFQLAQDPVCSATCRKAIVCSQLYSAESDAQECLDTVTITTASQPTPAPQSEHFRVRVAKLVVPVVVCALIIVTVLGFVAHHRRVASKLQRTEGNAPSRVASGGRAASHSSQMEELHEVLIEGSVN